MMYQSYNRDRAGIKYFHLHGAFIESCDNDDERYDSIDGRIRRIVLREHKRGGDTFHAWHIVMEDGDELYDLMLSVHSPAVRNIIMALASDVNLTFSDKVRIEVFVPQFNNKTVADVYKEGKRLRWYTDGMPPVFYQDETGNPDFTLRDEWLAELVPVINARLAERSYGARGEED